MNLPEGLRLEGAPGGHSHITDAQGHVWVTIHPAAPGDPDEWRTAIVQAVCAGLSAPAESTEFRERSVPWWYANLAGIAREDPEYASKLEEQWHGSP